MHSTQCQYFHNQYSLWNYDPPIKLTLRGHVQTIIGKINVIVKLGGREVQGVTLRIAAEGKTVSKQGKFVSNHDVKSGGGGV